MLEEEEVYLAMTNLKQRIKKVEKEFDKRFMMFLVPLLPMIPNQNIPHDIKHFLSTSIREIVKASFKEGGVKDRSFKVREELSMTDIQLKEDSLFYIEGYNQAIKELEKKRKEYLDE